VVEASAPIVWFYIGARIGLAVYLLVAEAIPYWRDANRRIDADLRFMRAIPKGMEDKE